mmetsp:Transcript_87779/g.160934  ORF Transcript_87779/g.160934 Transcript_87779/m.160934 type:complete len:290 (-) Transcript_87779:100-969(-)
MDSPAKGFGDEPPEDAPLEKRLPCDELDEALAEGVGVKLEKKPPEEALEEVVPDGAVEEKRPPEDALPELAEARLEKRPPVEKRPPEDALAPEKRPPEDGLEAVAGLAAEKRPPELAPEEAAAKRPPPAGALLLEAAPEKRPAPAPEFENRPPEDGVDVPPKRKSPPVAGLANKPPEVEADPAPENSPPVAHELELAKRPPAAGPAQGLSKFAVDLLASMPDALPSSLGLGASATSAGALSIFALVPSSPANAALFKTLASLKASWNCVACSGVLNFKANFSMAGSPSE